MRIIVFGECPWVPSSAGKITYYIARGLIELGHEVLVLCQGTGRPYTDFFCFNPAKSYKNSLIQYPDVDIYVAPYRQNEVLSYAMRFFGAKPDGLIAYGTTYGQPMATFNDDAGKLATEHGIPSVAYVTNDVFRLRPSLCASLVSYTTAVGPTEFSIMEMVKGLRVVYENVDDLIDRFGVVYHGIDFNVYNERVCQKIREAVGKRPSERKIIAMFAKNHVRKDFYAIFEAVARLVKEGYDLAVGYYAVRAVAAPVWELVDLVEQAELATGVDLYGEGRVIQLPQLDDTEGVSEDSVISLYCCNMDIHYFATRGESFGLPPLESVSLGVPTIVNAVPAQREIWGDTLPLVNVRESSILMGLYETDIDDAVEKLRMVLDGKWDYTRAKERARLYDYREMARGLLKWLEKASEIVLPLSRFLRKRPNRKLNEHLPGQPPAPG